MEDAKKCGNSQVAHVFDFIVNLTGQKLLKKYEIGDLIGSDGNSFVFECRDTQNLTKKELTLNISIQFANSDLIPESKVLEDISKSPNTPDCSDYIPKCYHFD